MQIVIDIPEEKYDAIKSKYNTFPAEMKEWGLEAIRSGKPLPKGHGRLIDADALDKVFCMCTCKCDCNFLTCPVYSQKTIIEADKESEG